MTFSTVFTSDHVEFTSTSRLGLTGSDDNWFSVKISVQEIGLSNRWIYVQLKETAPPVPPLVHMALTEGWDLTCDERAMILVMEGRNSETRARTIYKLRFVKSADFWSFVFQVSLSRVREYRARDRRAGLQVGEIAV